MLYSVKPFPCARCAFAWSRLQSIHEPRIALLPLQGKASAAKPKVVNAKGLVEVSGDSSHLSTDGDEEESPKVKSVTVRLASWAPILHPTRAA